MFEIMKRRCDTCIYCKDSSLGLKQLEDQVRDKYMGFKSYRICHHARKGAKTYCRGFWDAHKDEFQLGQIAQRLNMVDDTVEPE